MLPVLPTNSVDCIFTSPSPIRKYSEFEAILEILGELCPRVLKPMGSMWVHMEDCYSDRGTLMQYPHQFSIKMVNHYKWLLRAQRIWHAPVKDQNFYNDGRIIDNNRLIMDHSYIFHFTTARYGYYNNFDELGGQPCSIFTEKQYMPPPGEWSTGFSSELIRQSLVMSCPEGGTVLDPFCGTGSTGAVTLRLGRSFIGIENDETKITPTIERLSKILI